MVLPLLLLLISGSHLAPDGISDFLEDQSLQHLAPAFILEEIEVRQIPSIPDNYLVELGVRTMGARLRLRSAAAARLDQSRSQGSQDQAQSTTSATSTPTIPATSSFSSDPAQSTTSATSSDQAQDPDHLTREGGDVQGVSQDLDLETQMANEGLAFFSITKKTGWCFS